MAAKDLLARASDGFKALNVREEFKKSALKNLEKWLSSEEFSEYHSQIEHLINSRDWDYLLDSFYQIIPFGTGGRRGEVGIGPNRINPWTIQTSAQGHSQYLLKRFEGRAKTRGIVLAYDVREFFTNPHFSPDLPNPVDGITSKDFANLAAEVYAGNDIKVYIFSETRTTPELSFAIRHLNACAGAMFSASHNPPEHNGKKVYDEFGGQLIPPDDEILVEEVTQNVHEVQKLDTSQAKSSGLLEEISTEVDTAYLEETTKLSLSQARGVEIVYTPLHGTGSTSIKRSLEQLGFTVNEDPNTSNPSGKFENVTFNIPNPEIIQSFDTSLKYAKQKDANIILNSDPDADRIGAMVKHKNEWIFIDGNSIGTILTNYVIQKRKSSLRGQGIVIKTDVTTNAISRICEANGIRMIGNLLVGFKYIANELNKLEKGGEIDNFLFAAEESHGYLAGNYSRDKDAVVAAIWLSELAAELKNEGRTLLDYLEEVYSNYGYFLNYLTEIRLPGAEGFAQIRKIQDTLRSERPKKFGDFIVTSIEDWQDRKPLVSETDKSSKDALVFHFEAPEGLVSTRITVRPSGTEPKIKIYFEIGTNSYPRSENTKVKSNAEAVLRNLEKEFMTACYKIIGVDFPERGFLLFWQLPLKAKLKYFEVEDRLVSLKDLPNKEERKRQLEVLLSFLGSDPIEKVDKAFLARFNRPIREYLDIAQ